VTPVVLSCPLGHKCEEARDGALHRCAWYVQLRGMNPNTGEQLDEHGCAMGWLPVLLVETAGAARGTSAAVESFRNTMERQGNFALGLQLSGPQTLPLPQLIPK